jgi:hypothetical protein
MTDAGIDIDMDHQLAGIQGLAAGVTPEIIREVRPGTITATRSVELKGKRFRIADKIGAMPLLKFSMFADMNIQDPRALGAMYTLLRDCIYSGSPACGTCEQCNPAPCGQCRGCNPDDGREARCWQNTADETACAQYKSGDWAAFEEHAMTSKADADELMDVVTKVMELVSGRPTEPPGTSSSGPRTTSGRSTGSSSGRRAKGSRR